MTPEQHQRLVRVEDEVKLLRVEIAKFKGFVAGVVFVISSAWAVIVIVIRSHV